MMRTDPARRPSIDALLASPYLSTRPTTVSPTSKNLVSATTVSPTSKNLVSAAPLDTARALADGCALRDVIERPLSIRVRLTPPLGLRLGEIGTEIAEETAEMSAADSGGGGAMIDEVMSGGAAAACGALEVGDALVAIGEEVVRDAPFDQVVTRRPHVAITWPLCVDIMWPSCGHHAVIMRS